MVCIYVDDLLVSSANDDVGNRFIDNISKMKTFGSEWQVKNLGRPRHFLGLEINWTHWGVRLTQTKMIERMRACFKVSTDLEGCKDCRR